MSKLLLCLLAVMPLMAQLPSHTLTITASRSVALQPDQVVFGLSVASGTSTTLDQIGAALTSLGITSANLSSANTTSATMLQWNFNLDVPISNLTATITSLTTLQQIIGQNNSGLTLTFNVNGTRVSQQLQQSQQAQTCTNANLISDATAQAQKLASAAGVTLGPIAKLSTTPLGVSGLSGIFAPAELVVVNSIVPANYSVPLSCSLTVQFRLLP
jgi:uncharacterized protein YggE